MDDLQRYKQSKEVFKQTCKCEKEEYKESVREKLLSLMKEPTKFWKYLKSLQTGITGSNNSISADEWYQYFKALFEQCTGNQYIEDNESDIVNENYMSTDALNDIHTLQLNFLLSDWLFSKYAECIENVHCTPRTAPRLRPDCAQTARGAFGA